MVLRAKHVGQYGEHQLAKNAGIVKGDIVTEFGGFSTAMTESQLIMNVLKQYKPGDSVKVKILRNGKPMEMSFKLP
jgi:S1-C subfamily serine protease